jgi:hypothetical protein
MLKGIREKPIIAGAYTSGEGICPMLAAHRGGGRTSASSFARTWDRFAFGGARVTGPRPATARELMVLASNLEASLAVEEGPEVDLAGAVASHRELVARRAESHECPPRAGRLRPGKPRSPNPRPRKPRSVTVWPWTRVVRSYDEYQRVLEHLEHERTALEPHPARAAIAQPELV